jgi:hypothetical protein
MVAGLLLSQTVCFGHWQRALQLRHYLAASWQRRCRRWLGNGRIEVDTFYGPLLLWAIQHWQKPGHSLHLALDATVRWNPFCVVVLSVVYHDQAIPLLWQTLEHPSASVSAEVVIALLLLADQLPADCSVITVLADRGFPSAELLPWFETKPSWRCVMRLRGGYLDPRHRCADGLPGVQAATAPRSLQRFSGCPALGRWPLAIQPAAGPPARSASQHPSPGAWSAISIPAWIWCELRASASAATNCSVIRNQGSSSWSAVACAAPSGLIACCWWWRSPG